MRLPSQKVEILYTIICEIRNHQAMTSTVEQLITKLAYILGVIALIAPITFIWLQARRPKGRLSGRGESLRTWSGVFLITLV